MKEDKGFSLIEVIVTIAVIGIVLIPLATFFINTSKYSINTKEQLLANEIAQQYVEGLKAKSYNSFIDFFDGNTSRTITSDDGSIEGFSKLPDGFTVHISYDKTIMSDYEISEHVDEVDFTINLNSAFGHYTINDSDNNQIYSNSENKDINLYILYDYSGDDIKFSEDNKFKNLITSIDIGNIKAFKIKCNNIRTSNSNKVSTNINIRNKTSDFIYVYKYIPENDVINPTVTIDKGEVIQVNKTLIEENNIIYKINITVSKNKSLLVNMNATRINN
jgi:prepilin-type N-terminal cleavage/methylation domain-containing protein